VFNFSGSEMVFLLLLALIILGPEKLPEAVRKFGQTYGEFKKVATGFQSEIKSALDEPMREMKATADEFKKAATFDVVSDVAEVKDALLEPFADTQRTTAAPPPTPPPAPAAPPAPPQFSEPVFTGSGDAPPLVPHADTEPDTEQPQAPAITPEDEGPTSA
jgi:sec-independent protein translocase protein TatB